MEQSIKEYTHISITESFCCTEKKKLEKKQKQQNRREELRKIKAKIWWK